MSRSRSSRGLEVSLKLNKTFALVFFVLTNLIFSQGGTWSYKGFPSDWQGGWTGSRYTRAKVEFDEAAYDQRAKRIVYWNYIYKDGSGNSDFSKWGIHTYDPANNTWEYKGYDQSFVKGEGFSALPNYYAYFMIYDSVSKKILIWFGVEGMLDQKGKLYAYDTIEDKWTLLTEKTEFTPRTMTYHPVSKKVVFWNDYGGRGENNRSLQGIYTYDTSTDTWDSKNGHQITIDNYGVQTIENHISFNSLYQDTYIPINNKIAFWNSQGMGESWGGLYLYDLERNTWEIVGFKDDIWNNLNGGSVSNAVLYYDPNSFSLVLFNVNYWPWTKCGNYSHGTAWITTNDDCFDGAGIWKYNILKDEWTGLGYYDFVQTPKQSNNSWTFYPRTVVFDPNIKKTVFFNSTYFGSSNDGWKKYGIWNYEMDFDSSTLNPAKIFIADRYKVATYDIGSNEYTIINNRPSIFSNNGNKSAAYDAESKKVILLDKFGRYAAYDYNTNSWSNISENGPWNGSDPSMTYDHKFDRVIALNTFNNMQAYDYNSDTWTSLTGPGTQEHWALAYDVENERTIAVSRSGRARSYNFATDSWENLNPPESSAGERSLTYDFHEQKIMMMDYNSFIHEFDYLTNSWTKREFGIYPGGGHSSIVYDISNKVSFKVHWSGKTKIYDSQDRNWSDKAFSDVNGSGVTTTYIGRVPPKKPKNITVVPSHKKLEVSWDTDTSAYISQYLVWREETGKSPIYALDPSTSHFEYAGLDNARSYEFKVSTTDKFGLESQKEIVKGVPRTKVIGIKATNANGPYFTGDKIEIVVDFDGGVNSGNAAIKLDLGYSGESRAFEVNEGPTTKSTGSKKVFVYQIDSNDFGGVELKYESKNAILQDPFGNGYPAIRLQNTNSEKDEPLLTLPNPGYPGSISHAKDIFIVGAKQTSTKKYVSSAGNNNWDGREEFPFRTISHAISVASSGDTIFVLPGEYSSEISITDLNLTLMSRGGRDSTIISNNILVTRSHLNLSGFTIQEARGGYAAIKCEQESNLQASDIKVLKSESHGIQIAEKSYATINNAIISDNKLQGIVINSPSMNEGSTLNINNSIISNNQQTNSSTPNNGGGIYINSPPTEVVVSNSIIRDNIGENGGGIYVHEGSIVINSTSIFNNTARSNGGGVYFSKSLTPSKIRNSYFYNNKAMDNYGGGVGTIDMRSDLEILNCTFSNNYSHGDAGGVYWVDTDDATSAQLTLKNSILWNNSAGQGTGWDGDDGGNINRQFSDQITGDKIQYNIIQNLSYLPNDPLFIGNFESDPLFKDVSSNDFSLKKESPAIDRGDPDLDGDGTDWTTDKDDQDPDNSRMDLGPTYYNTPPEIPSAIRLFPSNEAITIRWDPNAENDLKSYNIYYGTTSSDHLLLKTVDKNVKEYVHTGIENGKKYYYALEAIDDSDNSSGKSAEYAAVPWNYTKNYSLSMGGRDRFELPNDLSFETDQITFMVWVKSLWQTENEYLFDLMDWNDYRLEVYKMFQIAKKSNNLKLYIGGSQASWGPEVITDFSLASDSWSQVVVTIGRLSGWKRIYVNGVLVVQKKYDSMVPKLSQSVAGNKFLGNTGPEEMKNSNYGLKGNLDEFAIWTEELDSNAVKLLYNDGEPLDARVDTAAYVHSRSLIQYYQFNEGDSTVSYNLGFSEALNNDGQLKEQTTWSLEVPSEDSEPPLRPINLTITPNNGNIRLDWDQNVEEDLAGYKVYMSTDSSNLELIETLGANTNTFLKDGLTNDQVYWFAVTAFDKKGNQSPRTDIQYAIPYELIAIEPKGQGTPSDPFQITSIYNLHWLSSTPSYWTKNKTGSTQAVFYVQMNDIDAINSRFWDSGKGFKPIGNYPNHFSGHYNGNGYSIKNLTIDRPSENYVGFFGYLASDQCCATSANIKSIQLINISVKGNNYVGGVAGSVNSYTGRRATLEKIKVDGSIVGSGFVGSIAGELNDAIVRNSYSTAKVEGQDKVGGIIGSSAGSNVDFIYAGGEVKGGSTATGGFFGQARSTSQHATYFDIQRTQQSEDKGYAIGKTSNELRSLATMINDGWDFVVETQNGDSNYWDMDLSGKVKEGYPFLSFERPDSIFVNQIYWPKISSISSSNENGYYKLGDSITVSIDFSEEVTLTENGNLIVNLGLGPSNRSIQIPSFVNSSKASGTYVVQSGDLSNELNVSSLNVLDGSIRNQGNFEMYDFSIPVGKNLADASALIVDGVPPTISQTSVSDDFSSINLKVSETVYSTNTGTDTLKTSDFKLVLSGGIGSLSSSTPNSISFKDSIYVLGLPITGSTNGNERITVIPAENSIFDIAGNVMDTLQSNNTLSPNDKEPPNAPKDIFILPGRLSLTLTWSPNPETDLSSYNIYRGTSSSQLALIKNISKQNTYYNDSGLNTSSTYYYQITALDSSGNESLKTDVISGIPGASQKNYVVKQEGGGDFTTIQAAISAAQDGDSISIHEGTYYEELIINQKILTIIGVSGKTKTILDGLENFGILKMSNGTSSDLSYLKVSGITFKKGFKRNDYGNALYIRDVDEVSIVDCNFESKLGVPIYIDKARLKFQNVSIVSPQGNMVLHNSRGFNVENSSFASADQERVVAIGASDVQGDNFIGSSSFENAFMNVNRHSGNGGSLVIQSSAFKNFTGSALEIVSGISVDIINSTFTNITSSSSVIASDTLKIEGSIFSNLSLTELGRFANTYGPVTVDGSTFINFTLPYQNGALFKSVSSGDKIRISNTILFSDQFKWNEYDFENVLYYSGDGDIDIEYSNLNFEVVPGYGLLGNISEPNYFADSSFTFVSSNSSNLGSGKNGYNIGAVRSNNRTAYQGPVWFVSSDTTIATYDGSKSNPFPRIHQAIFFANEKDTVVLNEGNYYDDVAIKFNNITLGSQFLIDGDRSHISMTNLFNQLKIEGDLTNSTKISGITLRNIRNSAVVINEAAPILDRLVIMDNYNPSDNGGGIFINASSQDTVRIFKVILYDNKTNRSLGDAIYATGSNVVIDGITSMNNSPNEYTSTSAQLYFNSSKVRILNSIIRSKNNRRSINTSGMTLNDDLNVFYSNIDSLTLSSFNHASNSYKDPRFVDEDNNDFNLKYGSPAIDTGDPSASLDPDGTRRDMGALYFTLEDNIPPTVAITSPNISTSIGTNDSLEIIWNANDNFLIQSSVLYFSPNGENFIFVDSIKGDVRAYRWDVDDYSVSDTNKVAIEVIDIGGNSTRDTSYAFTITDNTPPKAQIISDFSSFSIQERESFSVEWKVSDNTIVDSTQIFFQTNNQNSTYVSTVSFPSTRTDVVAPAVLTSSARLLLRSYDRYMNSSEVLTDNFEIKDSTPPSVEIILPSLQATLLVGDVDTLTWSASDNDKVQTIDLSYSSDKGARWNPITQITEADQIFKYVWQIPNITTDDLWVLIVATDRSGFKAQSIVKELKTKVSYPTILTYSKDAFLRQSGNLLEFEFSQNMSLDPVPEGAVAITSVVDQELSFETSYSGRTLTVDIKDELYSLDTLNVVLDPAFLTNLYGYQLDTDGDQDGANTIENFNLVFSTPLWSDFNISGGIDISDMADFYNGWKTKNYLYELGPFEGNIPHVKLQPDNTFNIEDLMGFIMMGNYYLSNTPSTIGKIVPLGKPLNIDQVANTLHVPLPKEIAFTELQINYNPIILEFENIALSEDFKLIDLDPELGYIKIMSKVDKINEFNLPFKFKQRNDLEVIDISYTNLDNNGVMLSRSMDKVTLQNIPTEFSLSQNYPNPFNPTTTIEYDVPMKAFVELVVYDLMGREVVKLINEEQIPGFKSIIWNGLNKRDQKVSNGIYLYQLRSKDYIQTRKMLFLK